MILNNSNGLNDALYKTRKVLLLDVANSFFHDDVILVSSFEIANGNEHNTVIITCNHNILLSHTQGCHLIKSEKWKDRPEKRKIEERKILKDGKKAEI